MNLVFTMIRPTMTVTHWLKLMLIEVFIALMECNKCISIWLQKPKVQFGGKRESARKHLLLN